MTTVMMPPFIRLLLVVMVMVVLVASPPKKWTSAAFAPVAQRGRICGGQPAAMVRNIDLAEALIFYGASSLLVDDENEELLPGVEYLLDECARDGTAVLAILETAPPQWLTKDHPSIAVHAETIPPPHPKDLWESTRATEVEPHGFGGSSGFGSKAPDPPRAPLPKHCVVLATTEDQCRAARAAGMRVVCLEDNNPLADAVLFETDWSSLGVDDIATPGSFWLNPPHPRDDDGNALDPEAIVAAAITQENSEEGEGPLNPTEFSSDAANEDLSDDDLAGILADLDPL